MEWTQEKPTVSGIYWVWPGSGAPDVPPICEINFEINPTGRVWWTGVDSSELLSTYTELWWYGPIEPPEPPKSEQPQ